MHTAIQTIKLRILSGSLLAGFVWLIWFMVREHTSVPLRPRESAPILPPKPPQDVPLGARTGSATRQPSDPEVRNAGEQSAQCMALVVDEQGRTRQAEVSLVSPSGKALLLGYTDEQGRVPFAAPSPPFTLVAKGVDIETRERLVQEEATLVRVVVRAGSRISGRVVRSGSGAPAPPHTFVVAWPRTWKFTPRELAQRVRAHDPRLLLAATDAAGFFELLGLGESASYCATASAPGWCDWPPSVLEPGDGNVLCMEYILGIRVVVQEPGKVPVRTGPLRTYGRPLAFQLPALPGGTYLPVPNPVSELLGASKPPVSGDPTQAEILIACDQPMDALGPISFQVTIPGYCSRSAELWALPTDHGVPEQVIDVIPTPEGRRDILLEFTNVPEGGRVRLASRAGVGQVVLSAGQYEDDFFADIEDFARPLVLRSVPRSLELKAVAIRAGGRGLLPAERLDLIADAEKWKVDLGGIQALVVDLMLPDETLYQGPAMMLLGKSAELFGTPVLFDRAPYVLFSRYATQAYLHLAYPGGGTLSEPPGLRRRARIDWP